MKLFGYSDRWSVKPGEAVNFMVTCEAARYGADVIRLLEADDRPEGPGFRETVVDSDCAGDHPGRVQKLRPGSHLRVAHSPRLNVAQGLTLMAWICPSIPKRGMQSIIGKCLHPEGAGYCLFLGPSGELAFEVVDPVHKPSIVRSTTPLLEKTWYHVAASYDRESGGLTLVQAMTRPMTLQWPGESPIIQTEHGSPSHEAFNNQLDLLVAGVHVRDGSEIVVGGHFNGKIERPKIFDRALTPREIEAIRKGDHGSSDALLAAWDFGALPYTTTIADTSANRLTARVVNNPSRAMRGHNWTGHASHFANDPEQYQAIYFHDDDVEDAGWEIDFRWTVPEDLKSGVYAVRLRSDNEEDYIPVFVRPKAPTAPVLFLAPTFTYAAYANERFHAHKFVDWSEGSDHDAILSRQDAYTARHPELGCSLYDLHTDGSVCSYSSRLRPVLNFRPKLTSYWNGAGRHFGADMYLIDWLDREGIQHDIVTDEDLHIEGRELLSGYRVVLTGSHPEYFSDAMRKALDAYLAEGGRLMYLGGNGCWWVTSVDPSRPHVIEVRKSSPWGVPGIVVEPGEHYHSTTGELGGGWRSRSLGPESLFGVGYTSEGFCQARPYRRQPGSFDPTVAFVFEGIGNNEVIGDFGLALGGAAGDEFDRVFDFGSPPGTMILASSSGHSNLCLNYSFPYMPKQQKVASVRADMTYYKTAGGGEVFSVGSMCWCTSLPYNGYRNNVATITRNVLRRFMEGKEL